MPWLLLAAAFAQDPTAHLAWKADRSELTLRAPAGEHVAPDAPMDLRVKVGGRSVRLEGMGADLARGLALGDVRGHRVQATLSLSLCEDGGSRCRFVDATVGGEVPTARKGSVALVSQAADASEASGGFPSQVDADAVWEEASGRAAATGKPVLLDFGAVWCPPCNLMAAEVLDAQPRPSVVDAFIVAVLDVDDPSSWTLKDRYAVGSYPTLVAVDPDGRELGRKVGYRSVDDTVGWMDAVITGAFLQTEGTPSARQAGALAWAAVQAERLDEARRLVQVGEGEPEQVSFRLARFALDKAPEDATWLAERAPDRALDWVGFARGSLDDPIIGAAVQSTIEAALPDADPLTAADLLELRAELADPAARPAIYGAAAALLRTEVTGDPRRDKGLYGWLAFLTEKAGDVDGAVAILEGAAKTFPHEPTFHASLARLYLRNARYAEALPVADTAFEQGWGDNRLTAARLKTEALVGLGRMDEARVFVLEVLDSLPEPGPDVDVRTHRYRRQLAAMVGAAE